LSEAEDTRLEKYSFFGRQDELVVLVAERLEGGPVSSRVSTLHFPGFLFHQVVQKYYTVSQKTRHN